MASEDVTALLDTKGCYCLNESRPQQFMHLFAGDHTLALQSDTDEQLLLHLAFNQTISLKQMQIGVPSNTSCPRRVKLFRNLLHPDFTHAAETPPTQTMTLVPSAAVITIALHATKWKRTDSVTIFVEDNHGAEASVLCAVRLLGVCVDSLEVKNIGPTGGWLRL